MKGYKVFDPDWTCKGFRYEVGKTYEHKGELELCRSGFHFCKEAVDCFQYYRFNPENKVAEVMALGRIIESDDDTKCVTDKIKIVRELSWYEVLDLVNVGCVNTGCGNSGNGNSGNHNKGHHNSGHCNSGNHNSGSRNSGSHNSGIHNSGNCNSGNHNSGHCNSGHWNSGIRNSGDYNSGIRNSGNYNSGDWNSGSHNRGDSNSGDWNSGIANSGNYNSGSWNSGDCNSGSLNNGDYNSGGANSGHWNKGNWNSGDFNTTTGNSGCFCTGIHTIRFFDKPSNWTLEDWRKSDAYLLLRGAPLSPVKWISGVNMTDEEKAEHPKYTTTGGYLKELSIEERAEAAQKWWDCLDADGKQIIKNIPNFDPVKFKQITGIEVN